MKIDKRWLLNHLTQEELMMYFNVAMLNSHYKYFDLDTIQAIKPKIFAHNFQTIKPLVNEQGILILESLKNKILEFQSSYLM